MNNRLTVAATLALLALIPAVLAASATTPDPTEEARAAAEAWLGLMDDGDYEASWTEAAVIFKDAVTAEAWAAQATSVRGQIGAIESRELAGTDLMSDPPGAPAGEYARIRFESEFSGVGMAGEVVVVVREADRGWRVAGYFMVPPGS